MTLGTCRFRLIKSTINCLVIEPVGTQPLYSGTEIFQFRSLGLARFSHLASKSYQCPATVAFHFMVPQGPLRVRSSSPVPLQLVHVCKSINQMWLKSKWNNSVCAPRTSPRLPSHSVQQGSETAREFSSERQLASFGLRGVQRNSSQDAI